MRELQTCKASRILTHHPFSAFRLHAQKVEYTPPAYIPSPRRHYAVPADPVVTDESQNPILAEVLKKRREAQALKAEPGQAKGPQMPKQGSLAPNSIVNYAHSRKARPRVDPSTRIQYLDPRPHQRRRWERKMVIRTARRRGRLSKDEILKRTERFMMSHSQMFRTSVKKLSPLANQIVGKPIEDAIVQMRFSKKKVATSVRNHLAMARDKAIVSKGMGLGQAERRKGVPTKIALKDGTKHKIEDRTGIYVDQAWVNKGSYRIDVNPRARGRRDILRLPQTRESSSAFQHY